MKKYSEKCEISNLQFWDIATPRHVTQTPGGRRANLKLPETAFHGPLSHRRSRPPSQRLQHDNHRHLVDCALIWFWMYWWTSHYCPLQNSPCVKTLYLKPERERPVLANPSSCFLLHLPPGSTSEIVFGCKQNLFWDFEISHFSDFFTYMHRSVYEVRQPAP